MNAHIKVTVDGRVLMDTHAGDYDFQLPRELDPTKLKAGATNGFQPWQIPTAQLISVYAGLLNRSADITVTTRDKAWTLEVAEK